MTKQLRVKQQGSGLWQRRVQSHQKAFDFKKVSVESRVCRKLYITTTLRRVDSGGS